MRSATPLLIVLSLAAPAAAEQNAAPQAGAGQTSDASTRAEVDVDRLPLNLNRIQRELRHAADLERREGLNLRYTIQIYGSAPPLQFFGEEEDLVNGPVPNTAPTHRELIDQVTPQEFRAPYADFGALMRWLSDRNKKKKQ